jgi:hypothetical protein
MDIILRHGGDGAVGGILVPLLTSVLVDGKIVTDGCMYWFSKAQNNERYFVYGTSVVALLANE